MPSQPHFSLSPTDISQFIRLDQCERYLKLRLQMRSGDTRFLREAGVVAQSIPPLLTRSGAEFEAQIEAKLTEHFAVHDCAVTERQDSDNARVLHLAQSLAPGETLAVMQPRLLVQIGNWQLRGDLDILRLERDAQGVLHALIVDMKSSTSAKNEHRLQVAFYHRMVESLFAEDGQSLQIQTGVLYRGDEGEDFTDEEKAKLAAQRAQAATFFGSDEWPLEIVADGEALLDVVESLVTGPNSRAAQIAAQEHFDSLKAHLTYKCDGCLFNEFCLKWSAENDDLSLLPHLKAEEKIALRNSGISRVAQLAELKDLQPLSADERHNSSGAHRSELLTVPEHRETVRKLSATWPVGPRLDELIHRARRYRKWKGDEIDAFNYIPGKGYSSLPYCDENHNANLVTIFIDAQHDYLNNRIYLLGALIVGHEAGEICERKSIVHLTDGPPDTPEKERDLFAGFARDLLLAVGACAKPDDNLELAVPLHLVFFNGFEQRLLLEGLGRHLSTLFATPLYDFVTQRAAFDSSLITFLDQEIRDHKNYPLLCQSLQAVAEHTGFKWDEPEDYRSIFRTRLFDYWKSLDEEMPLDRADVPWFTGRSRFNSQIPLEYAYAAWNDLPAQNPDPFATYRQSTPDLLRGFQMRRLEAMQHIAAQFGGNKQTEKTPFVLPENLSAYRDVAGDFAQALDEFLAIERHVELGAWKSAHLLAPERRLLAGDTLIAELRDEDQSEETLQNFALARQLQPQLEAWKEANPGEKMPREVSKALKWTHKDEVVKMRLTCAGADCDVETALSLSAANMRPGATIILAPRLATDSRLPEAERQWFTPTPKQLLYGWRAEIQEIKLEGDCAWLTLKLNEANGSFDRAGYSFGTIKKPLEAGVFTLDSCPNNWYGYFNAKVVEGLMKGEQNTLYSRLLDAHDEAFKPFWPEVAQAAQQRFLAGLGELAKHDKSFVFELGKQQYIGGFGDAPLLLVQGPPGTGKSYATAFALFSRLQGAFAAGLPFRAFFGCKTHAATDELLKNVAKVKTTLREIQAKYPALFEEFFDERLLFVPLFRAGRDEDYVAALIEGETVVALPKGDKRAARILDETPCAFVATTPGGVYRMLKDGGGLWDWDFCDCLILDEASQMNLPEAMMASLALSAQGQIIVVGDHRQMPPIVKHDWDFEPRRTFSEFKAFASLFETMLPLVQQFEPPALIQFEESFRLHADMAEVLRREIYAQDGIAYHSRKTGVLQDGTHSDDFVRAVLRPEHPIVIVVHDEQKSLLSNDFERDLMAPILAALSQMQFEKNCETLDEKPAREKVVKDGLGVVVPHRAQRAALQDKVPELSVRDEETGLVTLCAVDTVERFQGGERDAIAVGATESDSQYLLVSGKFLLDPRRLTVALSRARKKVILFASKSVFEIFSADEEVFQNALLWKHLLHRTCTTQLWHGERDGIGVTVWGNGPEQ